MQMYPSFACVNDSSTMVQCFWIWNMRKSFSLTHGALIRQHREPHSNMRAHSTVPTQLKWDDTLSQVTDISVVSWMRLLTLCCLQTFTFQSSFNHFSFSKCQVCLALFRRIKAKSNSKLMFGQIWSVPVDFLTTLWSKVVVMIYDIWRQVFVLL